MRGLVGASPVEEFTPDPAEPEAPPIPEDGPGLGLGRPFDWTSPEAEPGPPGVNPMSPRQGGPCGCVPDPGGR